MLRRSITILTLLSLLGLAMILVYAAWNRSGVDRALEQAQGWLREGKPREAIQLLNHAIRSLGPSGDLELRRQVHTLRYEAHEEVGNFQQALQDIEHLLRGFPQKDVARHLQLRRDKVRLMLLSGNNDSSLYDVALKEARAFLAEAPDDTVALELAGRILQGIYQQEIEQLNRKEFAVQLPKPARAKVLADLLGFIYRLPNDPEGQRRRAAFEKDLGDHIDAAMTRDAILTRIDKLRLNITECSAYYRKALAGRQPTFAALQGYTDMLLRGGQLDEAAILSWMALKRFPKATGSVIAAGRAIDAWARAGNPRQALAAGEMWLRAVGYDAFQRDPSLMDRWNETLVRLGLVSHELGAVRELDQVRDGYQRQEAVRWQSTFPHVFLVRGLFFDLVDRPQEVENNLRSYCDHYPSTVPMDGADLWEAAMQLRLAAAEKAKDGELQQTILDQWVLLRPEDPRPRLARTRLLLDRNAPLLAGRDAREVLKLDDVDGSRDEALALLLTARDRQFERDRLDSRSLFESLAGNGGLLPPSIPDPVLHIGIAELALAANALPIAQANLREAAERFRWSRQVRLLQARCNIELNQYALYDIEQVLADEPDRVEALLLHVEALRRSGVQPSRLREARLDLLRLHPEHPRAALFLVERLLAREAWDLAIQLAQRSRAASKDESALLWARGRAFLGKKDYRQAIQALREVPAGSEYRLPALALAVETAATAGISDMLPGLRAEFLAQPLDGETLVRVSTTVARQGELAEAWKLIERVGSDDAMSKYRNGAYYVLLGRIASALGQTQEAEDHWEAACSFQDGTDAYPLLALAFSLDGREKQAEELLEQVRQVHGHPLTLAYLHFRRGNRTEALAAVRGLETKTPLLRQLAETALELAFDPNAKATNPTAYRLINGVVARSPRLVLEALALAPDLAFLPRAERALADLRAMEWKPEERPVLDTLAALQATLAGRTHRAIELLSHAIQEQPLFLPAYDELIVLAEGDLPETLFTADMLQKYELLIRSLPPGLLPETRITTIWFRGLARVALEEGQLAQADNLLLVARLAAPSDPAPLELMVRIARRRGDTELALQHLLELIALRAGRATNEDLHEGVELAIAALATPAGQDPNTSLGEKVRKIADLVRPIVTAKGRDDAPLAAAAVLLARLRRLDPGENPEKARKEAIRLLEASVQPYAEALFPPHHDPEGIKLALLELDALGASESAREHLTQILAVDPSLLDLGLLQARLAEAAGDFRGAIAALTWIPELLPDEPSILAELGRLIGTYLVVDRHKRSDLLSYLEALPDPPPPLVLAKALLRLRQGDPAGAVELFDQCSDLDPRSSWLRDIAEILVGQQDRLRAVEDRMRERAASGRPEFHAAADIAFQLERLREGPPPGTEDAGGRDARRHPLPANPDK